MIGNGWVFFVGQINAARIAKDKGNHLFSHEDLELRPHG